MQESVEPPAEDDAVAEDTLADAADPNNEGTEPAEHNKEPEEVDAVEPDALEPEGAAASVSDEDSEGTESATDVTREGSDIAHEEWQDTSGHQEDFVPKSTVFPKNERAALTSYRTHKEVKSAIGVNQRVRLALQLQQDYETKRTVAADAATALQLEEERLRQLRRNGDTTRLAYQQVEVEKAWAQLTKLEKTRDLAELALHRQVSSATEAERCAMQEAQKTSLIAARRQQQEVARAQRIIRKEFAEDKRQVEKQEAAKNEIARKATEAAKHQKLGKHRLLEEQKINNEREQEANTIKEQRHKEHGERYLQLKDSVNKINSVIQAQNEEKKKKERLRRNENDRRKDALLAEGLNPHEVFRREAVELEKKKIERKQKQLRNLRGDQLIEMLLKDEKKIRKEQEQAQLKKREEEEYQQNLGGHVHYKKVVDYIKKVTTDHVEILDSTGAAVRIDPSKVTVQKTAGFGLGRWNSSVPAEIELVEKKLKRTYKKVEDFHETLPKEEDDFELKGVEETLEPDVEKKEKLWEPKLSKFEQDMMAKARIRHRENICQVQRCWAKEFTGRAFLCKPAIISFLDFEVDKKYTQVIEITNVSLTFNQFKLLPIEESVRDFFEIDYIPPGRMSAGITSCITLSFFPKVLKDISTVFPILAKTGKLEFPLKCATKKTVLSLTPQDQEGRPLISFGNILAGEKNTVYLSIKNQGALAAAYTLVQENPSIKDDFLDMITIKRPKEIAALDTTKFAFTFTPTALGTFATSLQLNVDNGGRGDSKYQKTYEVMIQGACVEVPIFVDKPEYDLKTIIAGHTYREAVTFRNRQTVAMKIQIEEPSVTPELNLNPLAAFCQGNGAQVIQAKFTPKPDFLERNPQYQVEDDPLGFRIPIKLVGADQVLPVWTALVGRLDTNNVVFDPRDLALGQCFVGSSVVTQLSFTNKSSLRQNYAFCRLPSCIRVEAIPDDVEAERKECEANGVQFRINDVACLDGGGSAQLGILLPYETITVNIVYTPESAVVFENSLSFKVHTDTVAREFPIRVRGQGRVPLLQFSSTQIDMAAIPAEIATLKESIELQNIANTPTRFSIVVPPVELAQLHVCPVCLTLQPKEIARIQIEFKPNAQYPSLLEDVEEEEEKQEKEKPTSEGAEKMQVEEAGAEENGNEVEKKEPVKPKNIPARQRTLQAIRKNGGRRWEGKNGLVCALWKLPVHVKQLGEERSSSSFLSVGTNVVRPTLVSQPKVLDFGEVTALQRKVLHISLWNKSENLPQVLSTDALPENARFSMLNAPRTVVPGKPFQISVAFSPLETQIYKSVLRIHTKTTRVEVILRGRGVCPVLALDPPSGCVTMGGVVSCDTTSYVTKEIHLLNISRYALNFQLEARLQASLNCLGVPPFILTPSSGTIPGKEKDEDEPTKVPIKITFRPHRPLECFQEKIYVNVANQTKDSFLYLYGHSFQYSMYLIHNTGYGPFDAISPLGSFQDELSVGMANSNPKLLPCEEKEASEYSRAQRISFSLTFDPETNEDVKLIVGQSAPQGFQGTLSTVTGQPGNFEFVVPAEMAKKFSVDPPKGTVAPAQQTTISFKYNKEDSVDALMCGGVELSPLAGIGQWIHCSVKAILSGGFTPPNQPTTREFVVNLKAYLRQI